LDDIRGQLKALSKRHSFEIISVLLDGSKNISQLSNEIGIPYTTAQQRIDELRRVGLLNVKPDIDAVSKRAIKRVILANFRVELTPRNIHNIVSNERANNAFSG
jgi:predicted transcriptional regulator